jgi:spore germination protein YaaH
VPVICYVETLFGGVTPEQLDFRPCTHVVDAFLLVDASGAIRPANQLPRQAVISTARRAGAKVLVSVGGATVPGETFSAVARNAPARARVLTELSRFVAQSGYDGVDLDWEFPTPHERPLHLELVRDLRRALAGATPAGHPPAVLTVPLAAYHIHGYDLVRLQQFVDYVILMGYDYRNPALGPWRHTERLWPMSSPTSIEASVRGAIAEMLRLGLGRHKLIVALPFYTSADEPWSEIREEALAAREPVHPAYLEKRLGDRWVTDPEALERKIAAVLEVSRGRRYDAAGIALWQLGHQGTHRDLTEAVLRATRRP